jgi:hypothetical protein
MGILIGMDEAGYGPHLGPLVIAATAWHVADECSGIGVQGSVTAPASAGRKNGRSTSHRESGGTAATAIRNPKSAIRYFEPRDPIDLYRLLRHTVCKTANPRRIPIADSKVLYSPSAGLRHLERGLHCVLRSVGKELLSWSEIVHYCNADADGHHTKACWPDRFDCTLPVDATCDELVKLESRFTRACDSAGVQPLFIRAKLVCPAQFNELVEYYGNKAAALSHVTVGLLREVVDLLPSNLPPSALRLPPSVYAVCDKHGGRNFYTAFLQHHFSEYWVAPVFESHAESHYEWGETESRMRVVFRVNGERFLPTALASMTAKYLRELAMRAFNEYWRGHLPDLKPTAGYYRDAWRFKSDIAAKQSELGIDDYAIWRSR